VDLAAAAVAAEIAGAVAAAVGAERAVAAAETATAGSNRDPAKITEIKTARPEPITPAAPRYFWPTQSRLRASLSHCCALLLSLCAEMAPPDPISKTPDEI